MALKHAKSGEVVDLTKMDNKMSAAIVKNKQFEIIHLIVNPDKPMAVHSVENSITIQCLEGKCTFFVEDEPHVLTSGSWLYLDGKVKHTIEAHENSKLLLTVLFNKTD